MKNITIILQRSELNYLIKYDTARISSERIINFSYNEFKDLSEVLKISLLQNSIPIYEQDHEVLIIEYDSDLVSYDNAPSIEFKGILSIIPLTDTGAQLLSSKLNTDFNILNPLDTKLYKSFINNRNHILRFGAGQKLCSLYEVSLPKKEFITDFKNATLFQINGSSPNAKDSTLAHLIDFNITPSFIPEGNIEALIKSACVGMKKLDREVDQITRSKFYSFVIEEKEIINDSSLFKSIQYVQEKIGLNQITKEPFNQLLETLSENGKYGNAFLLFSYFYFLKKEIEKNDYDVSAPKDDILELIHYDSQAVSKVLFMLGYTFSIQTISKSIQSFSKSGLLKTQKNLDLTWTPKVNEQKVIEVLKTENVKTEFKESKQNSDQILDQIENKPEEERAIEMELLVDKKQGKKHLSHTWNVTVKPEEEKLVDNKLNENVSTSESNINKASEFVGDNLFSNNIETTKRSPFTFQEFENNLKKRKSFLSKIISALNSQGIQENEITKEILIKCLKEIDEYEKQHGGLKVAAKEALKIFE